ncbi:MAG: hypothetical protein QNK37_24215, partial [Acidobacteriota bacterium]|nr:hypothetical protein [Acidobacteriota bacterium]
MLSLFLSISCNLPSSRQTGLDENYFKKQIQELTKGRWPVSGRLAGIGEQIPGKAEWTTDINLDLSRLNVDLEKEMARNPSPGLQNYQALAEFLNARSEKARAMLTKALSTAPDNPTLVNNLAVAYLTLADESSNQLPRYLALETVDQALNNGMVTQELLTNRALILQSLHLKTQVKEAWATFLELEPSSSPWRSAALKSLAELENTPDKQWAEAKKKLVTVIAEGDQATVGEIADRFPGKTRDWMETRLLAWAEGEKRALADVEALAESFSSKDRDPIELVLAIRAAAPELKAKLAKGLALIGEPYRGSKSAAPGAERAVRESLQLFGGLEPFQSRAKYQQVRILYALGEYRTITEQTDLLATFSKRNYKRLQARLQGAMATSFGLNDDFASYYRLYHKAYDIFTLLGDRKSAARSGMNTASALTIFGAPDAALNMRTEQLSLTDYVTDPGDLALIYTGIAEDLAALGLEHAASYFFRICYELALQSGDTASTVQATRELALHLYRTGRAAEANTLLQEAFAECPKIENPEDRTEEEAKLYLTQGEMQLGELPEQAASSLITAAELFEKRGYDTHLTLLRHLLAGAQLRQSQNGAALQTVLEGIEMVEKRRPREQQQFKVSYIDQWAAGLFDQAVDLYRQEGNWLEALLTSSRARALSLADRLKPNGKTRPMPESLGEKLPPNQRIIYYHLLQERL